MTDGALSFDRPALPSEWYGGSRWLHTQPRGGGARRFPLQFGRGLACRLLGCPPRRVHWKNCALPKEEEAELAAAFKRRWGTAVSRAVMS